MYVSGLISFASTVIFSCYIRHIWIKPVLCSRMVSLFHRTSPWTHRCLQSSPSANWNVRFKQRADIEFLTAENVLPIEIQTNASRLWWSVCWCEYSKTLGTAVQRWRIGASRFEWQNTKWKACDCKWSASSRSRRRTDPWWFCYIYIYIYIYKVCSFENNWCRHISFFISLKYLISRPSYVFYHISLISS